MAMAAAHGAVGVGEIQTKGVGNGFQNGIAAEGCSADGGNVYALGGQDRGDHA